MPGGDAQLHAPHVPMETNRFRPGQRGGRPDLRETYPTIRRRWAETIFRTNRVTPARNAANPTARRRNDAATSALTSGEISVEKGCFVGYGLDGSESCLARMMPAGMAERCLPATGHDLGPRRLAGDVPAALPGLRSRIATPACPVCAGSAGAPCYPRRPGPAALPPAERPRRAHPASAAIRRRGHRPVAGCASPPARALPAGTACRAPAPAWHPGRARPA